MTEEIKYVYLKSHPLFIGATEVKIKEACTQVKVKTVYRSESFSYGEGSYSRIYLLIQGKIKLSELNEEGSELIRDILTAPDIFGDLSLESRQQSDEYAEALTANTVVCYFDTSSFKHMLHESPQMAVIYANMVNKKLTKMERRHADLVFHDAKSRLIRFIKYWAQSDGNRIGDKIILNNYLTHTDIANVIATSRQSVNVLLNELRDAGALHYNRKRIELTDPLIWN